MFPAGKLSFESELPCSKCQETPEKFREEAAARSK